MTHTVSEKFLSIDWTAPELVGVNSSHVDEPIYTRIYKPEGFDENRAEEYPAVVFIHGAGYLQNAHMGWSGYFREFMFHSLLNKHGYDATGAPLFTVKWERRKLKIWSMLQVT